MPRSSRRRCASVDFCQTAAGARPRLRDEAGWPRFRTVGPARHDRQGPVRTAAPENTPPGAGSWRRAGGLGRAARFPRAPSECAGPAPGLRRNQAPSGRQ